VAAVQVCWLLVLQSITHAVLMSCGGWQLYRMRHTCRL
jgi:hypothetical protein